MAGKRVPVIGPEGDFWTVDESELDQLPEDARVLSKREVSERAVQERYEALPTGRKVLGAASSAIGALNPLTAGTSPDAPPTLAEYGAGVREGLTGGLYDAGVRKLADAVGGTAAGDAYAARRDEEKEASPYAHVAGNIAGFTGGAALGAAGGPAGAISAAGGVAEAGVERALAGLAAKGALGRAASTAAKMAVRGGIEGGALAGLESATDSITHNDPITGEKLYAAIGHGAIAGGELGGVLGFGGSLVASGARGALAGIQRTGALVDEAGGATERGVLARGARAVQGAMAPEPGIRFQPHANARPHEATVMVDTDALDAAWRRDKGFHIAPGEEGIGGRRKGFQEWRAKNPDAPIQASRVTYTDDGRAAFTDGRHRFSELRDAGVKRVAITVPRADLPRLPEDWNASPLPKGGLETTTVTGGVKEGIAGVLADPSNAARQAAHEQVWKAVGGGFGLQSTQYVKEAAKYFANGTRDLGEIGLRYGVIDMGAPEASPIASAFSAAKSGTPAAILPKLESALDGVGQKIGEITDASGARIDGAKLATAMDAIAQSYESTAASRPVGRSVRAFGADLLDSMGLHAADSTASVQDALRERKAIDRLVFQDSPTLDPKMALEAKRKIRTVLEDIITESMDAASGKVPGALKDEYRALKKDYHGLRILTEAAEDSAARASKHATFGMSALQMAGGAIASGHIAAAPVLAVGTKVLKERGNAAAAAFLARAADRGTFESVLRRFDARVSRAAAGVLEQGEATTHARPSKTTSEKASQGAVGKAEVKATQAKGEAIVRWVGSVRANPTRLLDQLQEAAAIVSKSAGPDAAGAYTAATLRAIRFVAAHVPVKERRDPLDPRTVPPLSHEEASQLVQAAKYAAQPSTVLDDFEKGVVTSVGIRAAKTLIPEAFSDFQMQLQQNVTAHMMRNRRLSQSQRLRIDRLLEYPAGADLRPEAIRRLQGNFAAAPQAPGGPTPAPTGNGPVSMKVQQSGFDGVEARMTG